MKLTKTLNYMEQIIIYLPILLAILGLAYMGIKSSWVNKQDAGTDKMQSISRSIQEGAMAFLKAEYKVLVIFVIVASIALFSFNNFSSEKSRKYSLTQVVLKCVAKALAKVVLPVLSGPTKAIFISLVVFCSNFSSILNIQK